MNKDNKTETFTQPDALHDSGEAPARPFRSLGEVARKSLDLARSLSVKAGGMPAESSVQDVSGSLARQAVDVGAKAAGLPSEASMSDIGRSFTDQLSPLANASRRIFDDVLSTEGSFRQQFYAQEATNIGLEPTATPQEIAQAQSAVALGLSPHATIDALIDEYARREKTGTLPAKDES